MHFEKTEPPGVTRAEAALLAVAVAVVLAVAVYVGKVRRPMNLPDTPKEWVTDNPKRHALLSDSAASALNHKLEAYQKRTGHHVLVYIMRRAPCAIPTFCPAAFNAWGVGREGKNDGVVLFIFTKERMRWITVGGGLEGKISDAEASRICKEIVKPGVEQGPGDAADAAVNAGVDAIIAAIEGGGGK